MRCFSSLAFLTATLLFLPLSLAAAELEDVIVEARKVASEEKAEALAQSTLSEEWISDLYIDSFDELSFFVPGLYVQEEGINSAAYAIRGMTSNNTEATRTPRVSVWLHGMDISRTQGAYTALYDIERVDVFRGPAGSLFARGGQIGGVNLVNHFAEADNAGEVAASTGNFNELKLHGFYNATLGEHNAMRVALYHHQRDGYIENSDGNNLNSVDTQAGRVSFMQMINDARIDIQANVEQNKPSATSFQSFDYAPAQAYEHADINNADRLFINRDIADVFVRLAQPFSAGLDAEASVLYRDVQSSETFDPDGFSLDLVEASEAADYATLESVFRINHVNEYHTSSMGVAYFHETVDVRFAASINEQFAIRLPLIQSVIGIPAGTIDTRLFDAAGNPDPYTAVALSTARHEQQTESVDNESVSVFFDNTWFITDALSFSYGLRLSRESLHSEIFTPAFSDGGQTTITAMLGNLFLVPENAALPRSQASTDTQGAAGRLSLSYLVDDHMQVFATYARGRRPDILNYTEQSVLEHLGDETVDSWEAGLALNLPETYTRLDISLYRYNFRHFATAVSGVSALQVLSDDNASASASGVEIAYTQFFSNDILLFGNLAYNDAVFDESAIIKGENRFRYAPQWTGSLSVSKDYTLREDWRSRLTWQESFQSEVFFEDDNSSNAGRNRQGSYGLMNLYLDFVYRQNLTLNAFVKNVADKHFLIDAGNFGQLFGLPTFVPGMGRHLGAGVNYRF